MESLKLCDVLFDTKDLKSEQKWERIKYQGNGNGSPLLIDFLCNFLQLWIILPLAEREKSV